MNKILELLQALKNEGKLTDEQYNEAVKNADSVKVKLDEKDASITALNNSIAESKKEEVKKLAKSLAQGMFDEDKVEAALALSKLDDAKDEDSIKAVLGETLKANAFLKTVNDPNFVAKVETPATEAKLSDTTQKAFEEKK